MYIDSYQFGKVIVDGREYNSDCLIFDDSVHANWWRKQGHLLAVEDLQSVIAAKPSILVVGCGVSEMMKVQKETIQALENQGIKLIAVDTHKAIEKFNELAAKNRNVAAALHLTC